MITAGDGSSSIGIVVDPNVIGSKTCAKENVGNEARDSQVF